MPTWPLVLVKCVAVPPDAAPGADGPVPEVPLAVVSETAKAHAATRVRDVVSLVGASGSQLVREFDSPHGGSWLPGFVGAGWRVGRRAAPADVVVDVHGLVHEDDLDFALQQRLELVAPDGRFVIEFHHALALVENGQIDIIRHGHPVYLSLLALEPALARHGFVMLHAERSPVYGGSLLLVCGRSGEPDASVEAALDAERDAGLDDDQTPGRAGAARAESATACTHWLRSSGRPGGPCWATVRRQRRPCSLNRARVDPDLLPFIADIAPRKHGRPDAGDANPDQQPSDLIAANPDAVLVFTWDIADEVRAQLIGQGLRSDFYVPLPVPRLMS